ncbi:MAG: hypothetical protein A2745_01620 [Candidatus Harrisonbacteria bacterium RIFCSPHIGHO2_01_FULL_44_13]|uniref:Prepilin peptidase n=1 Tax=Candidatus Harrisonbacteria bacterium RIFCSPLOWO2_01_FULL_44_18 TaxID=1798407 RepID=A0A1G1ZKZ3_9BACT|nr:MAG: hypothetical protein A2745_01620 [Candidatus Harrisonbacteria bacterium RIFCSPHIGHO2_01_FULL_44_13]OGY65175.1 MAG: hypothetical protein A3A16_00580 [Candidatus Harrisonbacteria bacterium RIFCSPLOWO2_01_FULL_44_18]
MLNILIIQSVLPSVFLFVFGLGIGSFLNVVVLRYQVNQRLFDFKIIGGRSYCPFCQKKLSWYELIPLASFLIQKGRCRSCGQKISWQYPLVELATGLAFAFIPNYLYKFYGVATTLLANQTIAWYYLLLVIWILAALALILLSVIDFRLSIIPDQINLFLGLLGIASIFIKDLFDKFGLLEGSFLKNYALFFGLRDNIWLNHLFAAFLAAAIFGAIIFLSRGRGMGMGDLKLGTALGLLLGWPDILLALILAFVIGGIFGAALILTRKKTMKSSIPFGPFIVAGVFLAIFFGHQILEWYLHLLN